MRANRRKNEHVKMKHPHYCVPNRKRGVENGECKGYFGARFREDKQNVRGSRVLTAEF